MPGVKPRYTGVASGGRAGPGGVWAMPVAGSVATKRSAARVERMTPNIQAGNKNGPGEYPGPRGYDRCYSDLADVLCLQALRTLGDFEFDRIALGETAEALSLDRREVDEHIGTRLLRDKAKALRVVEPLHLTLCHTV